MEKQFIVELTENQAELINSILPVNHSAQVFQKYERRKKAEKKLDDMFVAQFSLRPVRKIKKENEVPTPKNTNPSPLSSKDQSIQHPKTINQNNKVQQHKKEEDTQRINAFEGKLRTDKKQVEKQEEIQQVQVKSSRSQRISKPTQTYAQFQAETFKRKIMHKDEQKIQPQPQKQIEEAKQKKQFKQNRDQMQEENKDQGVNKSQEENVIQKQAQKQKQKQSIIERASQLLLQSLRQSNVQRSIQQLKQKQNQTILAKPYTLHNDLPQNQVVSNSQIQQPQINMPSKKKTSRQEKKDEIIKEVDQKVIINPKQLIENENRLSKLPQGRVVRVVYNNSKQHHLTRCWRILQKLKAHKSSWPFRYPVEPIAQGVPDYFEKIKNPMDLKTIQKKLRGQKYKSEHDFFSDIELMLRNSYSYNPQTSNYYKLTSQIQGFYNQLRNMSYIPKLTSRSVLEQDEQNSEFSEKDLEREEVNQNGKENGSKEENESKNQKSSQQNTRKRNLSHVYKEQPISDNNQKSGYKVIVTSEGLNRIDPQKEDNQLNLHPQKIDTEGNFDSPTKLKVNQTGKKQISAKQSDVNELGGLSKKQSKQIKVEQKKKVNQDLSKEEKIEIQKLQNHQIKEKQQKRFGYLQPRISLIQRQSLLYDILHIQAGQIQNKIQTFLSEHDEKFKKFKHYKNQNCQSGQNGDNEGQRMEEQSMESYDFELRDLDAESYKLLRNEIDRLMKLDEAIGNERLQQMGNQQECRKEAAQ